MAFMDFEGSVEGGRPIILYRFTLGSVVWRYTSADEIVNAGGFEWMPASITDDGSKQTGEVAQDAMTIEAPSWIGPSNVFMSAAPSKMIQVDVFAKHEGDADLVTYYAGEISQINFPMPGKCRITCETLSASMKREGLRLGWQRTCPYATYDDACGLDKADFGLAFTVVGITGNTVNVILDAVLIPANGKYNNGFIEWNHPFRGVEVLMVELSAQVPVVTDGPNHALTIFGFPGDLFIGATGIVYPVCDFTPPSCQGFANYDNYGGSPDMPYKSPFDGSPIF